MYPPSTALLSSSSPFSLLTMTVDHPSSDPTDPMSIPGDKDADQLPDFWELLIFGNYAQGKDDDWDWTAIHKEAFDRVGVNVDVHKLQQAILNIPEEMLADKGVLYGEIYRFHMGIIKHVLMELGFNDIDSGKLHEATMMAREVIVNTHSLSNDALPCLERLSEKGLRSGAISNAEGLTVITCERFGLARYLEFVIDSAHVGVQKPDAAIFQVAMNVLNRNSEDPIHPGEIVYIGNDLETDALAAKATGMVGVWLNRDDKRVDLYYDLSDD